jgi:hypothetical protein
MDRRVAKSASAKGLLTTPRSKTCTSNASASAADSDHGTESRRQQKTGEQTGGSLRALNCQEMAIQGHRFCSTLEKLLGQEHL